MDGGGVGSVISVSMLYDRLPSCLSWLLIRLGFRQMAVNSENS